MCQKLAYFAFSRIFLLAIKISESPGSYKKIPDNVASKKYAGLFNKNLVKIGESHLTYQ